MDALPASLEIGMMDRIARTIAITALPTGTAQARENGTQLDKAYLTTGSDTYSGAGGTAAN